VNAPGVQKPLRPLSLWMIGTLMPSLRALSYRCFMYWMPVWLVTLLAYSFSIW